MKLRYQHPVYIWQRPEWPHFHWDMDAILPAIDKISRKHGILTGRMESLGFSQSSNAFLSALTDELTGSSAIEGVQINADSVKSSIARKLGLEYDDVFSEDHYVEGLVDVMLDAIKNSSSPLTEERLFGWHAALFPTGRSGMYRITVGSWRVGDEPMQVVSGAFGHEKIHYKAPDSDDVPSEMEEFLSWCAECNYPPVLMAAIAHLWFVTIHPFDDGNGRISRTVSDMLLARMDSNGQRYYSMSAEIKSNKKGYYDILESTQHGDLDITRWLLWFFKTLEGAIDKTLSITDITLKKKRYWDFFRDVEINERQRKVINRLWDGFEGKLTSSKWGKICHCSQDTALRDIKDLIAKGMLRETPEGGRNKSYLLPEEGADNTL